jgi:phage shock protein A
LSEDDESAARRAVGERIKVEDRLERLEPSIAKSEKIYEELKEELVKLHDRLNEVRAKLSELRTRQRAAEARKKFGDRAAKVSSTDTGRSEFEKFEDQVLQAETEVEVEREIRAEISGMDSEAERGERDARVDAELKALKKKVKSK